MKSLKSVAAIVGCLLIVCSAVLSLPLRWGVWLPDLINPTAIVLDEVKSTNGDHLRLTQLWVGDGYATEFLHSDMDGRTWIFAIDGDARKAWKGSLNKTNQSFRIGVLEATFFYDIRTHVVTDSQGKPQMVEEIPPGPPIVPPR